MEDLLKLYFDCEPSHETSLIIDTLETFFDKATVFCTYLSFKNARPYPKEFGLNYSRLMQDCSHDIQFMEVFNSLRYDPCSFLPALHAALHKVLLKHIDSSILTPIRVFISKYDIFTPMCAIRSALIQKFVAISGNIVKVYSKKPFITCMEFLCNRCKTQFPVQFPEGKFNFPKICVNFDCKNLKSFQPIRESAKCIDYQRIKIQEKSNEEQSGVPLTIDCEARNLDISDVSVGDPVTVMGIVKAESSDLHKNKNTGLYGLYLEISSINCVKESDIQDDEFSEDEIHHFLEISKTRNIFPVLVKSFCDVIYGLDKVKAGLLLALFGGSDDQGRNTSHILIIGDPGLGKTQLLRTTVHFSLRGNYVSATTKAGLTVNVSREGGQNLMRAGALIMADDGVCAIDEFDKMGKDQMAMLEVMEQQTVTVAKSGVYCSLKARATVIAAANAVGGHYNPGKTLVDNLKINAALLSRFDLIFLLLDNHDDEVSKHVISMHNGRKRKYEQLNSFFEPISIKRSYTQSTIFSQRNANDIPFDDESFSSFISRIGNSEKLSTIDANTVKRYIAYARKSCRPKLTDEAVEVINQYYTSMRKEMHLGCLAITTRQLESLRRLTEARAKVELREAATENDAIEVIKLYQETVYDFKDFRMPNGIKGKKPPENVGQLSVNKQQSAFIERLKEYVENKGSELVTFHELHDLSKELGLRVGDFSFFVEKLNMSNFLLKKGPGVYKVCAGYFS